MSHIKSLFLALTQFDWFPFTQRRTTIARSRIWIPPFTFFLFAHNCPSQCRQHYNVSSRHNGSFDLCCRFHLASSPITTIGKSSSEEKNDSPITRRTRWTWIIALNIFSTNANKLYNFISNKRAIRDKPKSIYCLPTSSASATVNLSRLLFAKLSEKR